MQNGISGYLLYNNDRVIKFIELDIDAVMGKIITRIGKLLLVLIFAIRYRELAIMGETLRYILFNCSIIGYYIYRFLNFEHLTAVLRIAHYAGKKIINMFISSCGTQENLSEHAECIFIFTEICVNA